MKIVEKITIFLLVAGAFFLLMYRDDKMPPLITSKDEASPQPSLASEININGQEYAYVYFKVSSEKDLFLYPNFENKESADDFYSDTKCQNMINAGFYSENNRPIGLFISEGTVNNDAVPNNLFNGYFILDWEGKAKIINSYSGEPVRLGLQSGPILIREGSVQLLRLTSDKESRRMVAAIDQKGDIYFIAIYKEDSVFIGPLLADLPEIINKIGKDMGVDIQSALNLDGGSASTFYTPNTKLLELTPVGSFFCEK